MKKYFLILIFVFFSFLLMKVFEKYVDECIMIPNDWAYSGNTEYNNWIDIFQDEKLDKYSIAVDDIMKLMKKGPIYVDQFKAARGTTYPICQNNTLSMLEDIINKEQAKNNDIQRYYQTLLDNGNLHCGRIRVGNLYNMVFGKKHYIPWKECVPQILPAKQRLLDYMKVLCYHQHTASNPVEKLNKQRVVDKYMSKPVKRGILYTGKAKHLKDIYQSITAHRMLNVSLPIEVWVIRLDLQMCQKTVGQLHKVYCYSLPNTIKGFASKYHALLSTKFTDVIFMDADNIAVRDVNIIFDSEGYKRNGMVLWPDLWGDRCRPVKERLLDGYTAFKTHVLWVASFGGLKWRNVREIAQEAEAGQIAIDIRRHGGLLEVGRKFIEDKFLSQVVNGDKDIFRIVNLIFNQPFYFVPHIPGFSVNKANTRDCLIHYFKNGDIDLDGTEDVEPFFFHQLKIRDENAMKQAYRLPLSSRSAYTTCALFNFNPTNQKMDLDELESPILPPLILEKLKKGEEYYLFAKKLFNHVDKEWSELLQKNYWFFYWDKVTKQTSILNQIGFDCTNF